VSASPVTMRNPRVDLRVGDVVRSYGNGVDLVVGVDVGCWVEVLDLETMRGRWHATACAASDVLARGVAWRVCEVVA